MNTLFELSINRLIWQLKVFLSGAQFDLADEKFNLQMLTLLWQPKNHGSKEVVHLRAENCF